MGLHIVSFHNVNSAHNVSSIVRARSLYDSQIFQCFTRYKSYAV